MVFRQIIPKIILASNTRIMARIIRCLDSIFVTPQNRIKCLLVNTKSTVKSRVNQHIFIPLIACSLDIFERNALRIQMRFQILNHFLPYQTQHIVIGNTRNLQFPRIEYFDMNLSKFAFILEPNDNRKTVHECLLLFSPAVHDILLRNTDGDFSVVLEL